MNLSDIAKLIEQNLNSQGVTQADVMKAMQSYLLGKPSLSLIATTTIGVDSVLQYVDEVEFSREEAMHLLWGVDPGDGCIEAEAERFNDRVDGTIEYLQEKDGRNRTAYTEDELIPLTYAVLFGEEDLGGRSAIVSSMERSEESIASKMRQIASILKYGSCDLEDNGSLDDQIDTIKKTSKEELLEEALDVLSPDEDDD